MLEIRIYKKHTIGDRMLKNKIRIATIKSPSYGLVKWIRLYFSLKHFFQ